MKLLIGGARECKRDVVVSNCNFAVIFVTFFLSFTHTLTYENVTRKEKKSHPIANHRIFPERLKLLDITQINHECCIII